MSLANTNIVCRYVHTSCRLAKSAPKISKPAPRHFARRIFDEMTKPVIEDPETYRARRKLCKKSLSEVSALTDDQPLSPIEKALARNITRIFSATKLLVVCHSLPINERQRHMDSMKLGNKGLMIKVYNNKVMLHVVRGTSLASLETLLCASNCYLISDDANLLTELNTLLKPVRWLIPLACLVENKILSPKDVEQLDNKSINDLIAQCASALIQPTLHTQKLLTYPLYQLSQSLEYISAGKT